VRSDLELGEMTAVRQIEDAFKAGKLELVTSREAWREQERAQDKSLPFSVLNWIGPMFQSSSTITAL
jgi:hypothetical protein